MWDVCDYGDTITGVANDPIDDAFEGVLNERNQCLAIHQSDGHVFWKGDREVPPTPAAVQAASRAIRWEQYVQAKSCSIATVPVW